MKIGIYGGAFNPVHSGHLRMASYFCKALEFDKLIFVPTANPPHKTQEDFASAQDRIVMLNLAIENEALYEISAIEFLRDKKSYTYDTLCELRELYPHSELFLLIGADQFLSFDKWYKAEEITKMVTICTAARLDDSEKTELFEARDTMSVFKNASVVIADYHVLCVSSESIRKKIKEKQSISEYVSADVEKYIKEKGLYIV